MSDEDNKPLNPIVRLQGAGFHSTNDPKEAQAKGVKNRNENREVRASLRRIAAHEFDFSEGAKPIQDQIKNDVFKSKKMTGAQFFAAVRASQTLKNWKAMEGMINDIDGKLVEKRVEAQVSYADLVNQSLQLEGDALVNGGDEEVSRTDSNVET